MYFYVFVLLSRIHVFFYSTDFDLLRLKVNNSHLELHEGNSPLPLQCSKQDVNNMGLNGIELAS
jgi:hypothetical protein